MAWFRHPMPETGTGVPVDEPAPARESVQEPAPEPTAVREPTPATVAPPTATPRSAAISCEDAMCTQNSDSSQIDAFAQLLPLTTGATAITATLQMLLAQASTHGDAMRASQHSSALARTAELAALGAMVLQMFPVNQTRASTVQAVSTPGPTPLAVS